MTSALFLGSEPSANPDVSGMLEAARRLSAAGIEEGGLTVRHGLRATASQGIPFGEITARAFVEVADYDPHRDTVLVLGPAHPHRFAALHTLILRAKHELGAVIQAPLPSGRAMPVAVPFARAARGPLDSALAVLEALRRGTVVAISPTEWLAVGPHPAAIVGHVLPLITAENSKEGL
jgi:hypothetical protein